MKKTINIYDTEKTIELWAGTYGIRILGGWGVKVGNFSIELENIKTNQIIKPKAENWRVQSYVYKQRAKRIFSLDISEWGTYRVEFKNQKDLQVRKLNLILPKFLNKPLPNKSLEICIS